MLTNSYKNEKREAAKLRTILLVEDEIPLARTQAEVLESIGWNVTIAGDGPSAIDAAASGNISLVLMDVNLGTDMDGIETAEEILSKKTLPIIFLSSDDEDNVINQAEHITSYGYVLKTSGKTILETTINMAIKLFDANQRLARNTEELKMEKDRLKTINELGSDYSYCHKIMPDGSYYPLWHVGSFAEITGYSPEELVELGGWGVLIHPDDIPNAEKYVEEMLSGKNSCCTARIVAKDGSVRWIKDSGKPWFDDSGNVIGTFGYAKDITEQMEMEERLRASELKHRMLYIHTPLPYQSLDKNGNLLDVNPAWLKTLGYSREEVIGRSVSSFLHPDAVSSFEQNFLMFKENGYIQDIKFKLRHKDGSYLHVSYDGSIEYDKDGRMLRTYCVFKDITKQEQTRAANKLLMQELNHRVKNNLLMVSSLLKLKDQELQSRADLSDLIHQIDTIRLIHQHLEQHQKISEVNIKDYLSELVRSIFDSVSLWDIDIKIDIENLYLPTKIGVTLGLIVNEVATNAMKHGFNPNEMNIFQLEQLPSDRSELHLVMKNSGKHFPDDIDLLRADGLGLKLIKMLTEQLGGRISLKKQPMTIFTLKLPLTES